LDRLPAVDWRKAPSEHWCAALPCTPLYCGAGEHPALKQLCHCITRLTLANEQARCNVAGQAGADAERILA
jgi:hypothetical protein